MTPLGRYLGGLPAHPNPSDEVWVLTRQPTGAPEEEVGRGPSPEDLLAEADPALGRVRPLDVLRLAQEPDRAGRHCTSAMKTGAMKFKRVPCVQRFFVRDDGAVVRLPPLPEGPFDAPDRLDDGTADDWAGVWWATQEGPRLLPLLEAAGVDPAALVGVVARQVRAAGHLPAGPAGTDALAVVEAWQPGEGSPVDWAERWAAVRVARPPAAASDSARSLAHLALLELLQAVSHVERARVDEVGARRDAYEALAEALSNAAGAVGSAPSSRVLGVVPMLRPAAILFLRREADAIRRTVPLAAVLLAATGG